MGTWGELVKRWTADEKAKREEEGRPSGLSREQLAALRAHIEEPSK